MKPVPCYWWDIHHGKVGKMTIVIESDVPNYSKFGEQEYTMANVESAERFIADLKAGRKRHKHDMWWPSVENANV